MDGWMEEEECSGWRIEGAGLIENSPEEVCNEKQQINERVFN